MKAKCIIVDDEPLAISVIKNYLSHIEDFELVATFENPVEAFSLLTKQAIDVLFLDINMPMLNGLDLMKSLEKPPLVVFTTAYREYAVESYELEVVDYLVKPIPFPRFMKAVNKLSKILEEDAASDQTPPTSPTTSTEAAHIFLKVDKKMVKVYLKDIQYIESLKDYIRVRTGFDELIVHQSLTGITEQLPSNQFIRIHRSFTIAVRHVKSIEGNMVEVGAKVLPIGRNYQQKAKEVILNNDFTAGVD